MNPINLILNEEGHGAFFIMEKEKRIAEMVFGIHDGQLTVYHTEVDPAAEGKGLAGQLLQEMVKYAREKNLQVIPLCPYVLAQFKRHSADYADIWKIENVK